MLHMMFYVQRVRYAHRWRLLDIPRSGGFDEFYRGTNENILE